MRIVWDSRQISFSTKPSGVRTARACVNVPRSHAERHEVKEVSGQTGIPVMVDGDVTLDDDDDIIPYLEKKYGLKAKTG